MRVVIDQAGAIAFRADGDLRFLLVRARRDPRRWILPKGRIERGESAEAAAARELHEEAGVMGELLQPVGEPVTVRVGGDPILIQYFLLEMTTEVPSPEGREKRWLAPEKALRKLSVDDGRELLAAALDALSTALARRQP